MNKNSVLDEVPEVEILPRDWRMIEMVARERLLIDPMVRMTIEGIGRYIHAEIEILFHDEGIVTIERIKSARNYNHKAAEGLVKLFLKRGVEIKEVK